jgi:hypothetical protein
MPHTTASLRGRPSVSDGGSPPVRSVVRDDSRRAPLICGATSGFVRAAVR